MASFNRFFAKYGPNKLANRFLAGIIKPPPSSDATSIGIEVEDNIVSSRIKAVVVGAVCVLGFCVVGPPLVIFGVPLAIGVGADLAETAGGRVFAALIVAAAACLSLGKRHHARWSNRQLLRNSE